MADASASLVSLFVAVGNLEQADACLARRTRLAPDDFTGWTSRAAVAFSRRNAEEGIAHLRRAAALDQPRLRRVLDRSTLARALESQGRTNLVLELDQMIAPPKKP